VNKRDVMLSLASGQPDAGYVPAAFFLHFGAEHHRGKPAVEKHLEYFHATDMDFVKIQYEHPFPALPDVKHPKDWAKVPVFDADYFRDPLDVVSGIVKAAGKEALVVVTLYSALMHAGHAVGRELLTAHLDEDPDAVARGLRRISQSILVFVRECVKRGVDGFYASTQGGEAGRFRDPAVFTRAVKPNDLLVMTETQGSCPFNILHVCDYHGEYADLAPYLDYPGHVVNCGTRLRAGPLSPREISRRFGRPFLGGMDRHGVIVSGTKEEIRRHVAAVLQDAPAGFALGADCTVPSDIPWDNLRAAIDAAHAGRAS
jgi:uroporphyrinogen decarboxylase